MVERADFIEGLSGICREVGFELERASPEVRERLRLLGELSESVEDVKRMVTSAKAVFAYVERARPGSAYDEEERRIVVLGAIFSDIGKTGPKRAAPDERRLVVEIFAVEGVRDETQPVEALLRRHFPGDAEERVTRFRRLGLDPSMPIRAFWDLHTGFTLELLEGSGVPPEAVAAAAAHHLLDDVNPMEIVGEDGRFARKFGENVAFDRAEKLVIALDKYDALRRRGGLGHEAAIAWLRQRLEASDAFRSDPEFVQVIDDLDVACALGRRGQSHA